MSDRPAAVTPLRTLLALVALLLPGLALVAPAVATAAPTAPAEPAASSGQIVYACGADLCTVDPATGNSAKLTTDGAGYHRPSISLDGTRIAAARGLGIVAGPNGSGLTETWATNVEGLNDLAISPDGKAVAASHWYTKLELVYSYPCGLCLQLVHYRKAEYWPAAGAVPAGHTGSSGVGFLGTALLSTSFEAGTWNPGTGTFDGSMEQVCVVANPADDAATCEVRVNEPAYDAATGRPVNLSDPTGSPDATLIAAVVGLQPAADGAIVDNPTGESPVIKVYDAASGALVTQIPGNGSRPSFSPDSSQLTFQGTDGSIYVVGARGGTPRKLVEGTSPSWGGVPTATPPPTQPPGAARVGTIKAGKKPIRVKKRTVKLPVVCPAGAAAGCKGTARIRVGKKAVTKWRSYSIAAGDRATVRLTVTKQGMRKIKRKPTKATAELLAPGAKNPSVKKKIKLRH